MLGMLISLIYINILIKDIPTGIIKASFGIYLGWICIATIANVTALLVNYNWNGFGISEEGWTSHYDHSWNTHSFLYTFQAQ